MNRAISFILLLTWCVPSTLLAAETKTKTPSTSLKASTTSNPYSGKQWEYMVVSFGKILFSDPSDEPELKAMGLSKLVAYSKVGVVSANEALGTQSKMDMLGKFGWELVGAVGSIGGDQELIFKRA